jgi:hypothetical protein
VCPTFPFSFPLFPEVQLLKHVLDYLCPCGRKKEKESLSTGRSVGRSVGHVFLHTLLQCKYKLKYPPSFILLPSMKHQSHHVWQNHPRAFRRPQLQDKTAHISKSLECGIFSDMVKSPPPSLLLVNFFCYVSYPTLSQQGTHPTTLPLLYG